MSGVTDGRLVHYVEKAHLKHAKNGLMTLLEHLDLQIFQFCEPMKFSFCLILSWAENNWVEIQ